MICLLLAASAMSCSDSEPGAAASPDISKSPTTEVESPPNLAETSTTVQLQDGALCDGSDLDLSSAQFAFVGTVTRVQPGPTRSVRWVTFAVEGWYTNDWGAHIKIYMPGFDVAPGDRLAVAGDATQASIYGVTGPSGIAEACVAVDSPPGDQLVAWEAQFGDLIEPGRDIPVGEPDPQALAAIDAAEQAWQAAEPRSYSYLLSRWDRAGTPCYYSTQRVIVIDDELADVSPLSDKAFPCSISDLGDPLADAFNRARQLAGAEYFSVDSDLQNGLIFTFSASDRTADASASIRGFSESTDPTIIGWDAVSDATAAARRRWAQTPTTRTNRIQTGVGEGDSHDLRTVETDGVVAEVTDRGEPVDPADLQQPWAPYTVEGVFDLIDYYADQGQVAAVFDEDTGVPLALHFDPIINGIDDELTVNVQVDWEG